MMKEMTNKTQEKRGRLDFSSIPEDLGHRGVRVVNKCHLSGIAPHYRCGSILDFATYGMYRNLKFLHMTDFSPPIQ